MGGGAPNGRPIKAVQTGGPSGGCIPADKLDTPVDYESLAALGSIMGSGGMIVMDDTDNMVEVARYFMEFCMDESCGKCIPCRAGTVQMHTLLDRIRDGRRDGRGRAAGWKRCATWCKHTSLCGLGQSAPEPGAEHAAVFPRRVHGAAEARRQWAREIAAGVTRFRDASQKRARRGRFCEALRIDGACE